MSTIDFFYEFASTYSYITAMRIAPLGAGRRRHGALAPVPARADLQGARAGRPRRSISIPPRAATWCATASGNAPRSGSRSACPSRFRRTRCSPRASRCAALAEGWGEDFSRAVYRAQFAEGRNDRRSADVIGAIVREPRARRRRGAGARPVRRRSSRSCAPRPRTRSGSAFSAHRASSRPANCSGAMTGSSRRSHLPERGLRDKLTLDDERDSVLA